MKPQKIFDLNIATVGVHQNNVQSGTHYPDFRPEEMDSLNYSRLGTRDLVIKMAPGVVYVSTRVLSYLTDTLRAHQARIGSLHLFLWDKEVAEDALRQAAYPSRSEREEWTKNRNFEIIAWIENLAALPPLDLPAAKPAIAMCWNQEEAEQAKRMGFSGTKII